MAKRTGKSAFGNALKANAGNETKARTEFIDLPGGITGGIAQIVEAKLGIYKSGNNEGSQFLYLAGVVLKPKTATSITKVWRKGKVEVVDTSQIEVEGQRTSYMEPICDTTKGNGDVVSVDEHVANAINELQLLGVDTSHLEKSKDPEKAFEQLLQALKKAKPTFNFGTSSSDPTATYPNPRVWERWYGAVDFDGEEDDDDLDDNTDEIPEGEPEEEDEDSNEDTDTENNEEEDNEEALMYEVEDIVDYKPPRAKKKVRCEILEVDEEEETCSLKNLDTGKTYKDVSWGRLSEVE